MNLPRIFKSNERIYSRNKTPIGEGGNSYIFKAIADDREYAIKIRKSNLSSKQNARFIREIDILTEVQHLNGIITIHDFCKEDDQHPFYVTDIATPSLKWIEDKNQQDIMNSFLEIAKTLRDLESLGIAHRDIKPENILFINDRPVLSDFGLAFSANDTRITCEGERQIGARMTMAPEMVRNPFQANYYSADVYSFAKTLWIFLTKNSECFEGAYSTHGRESLWNYDVDILGRIEDFLTKCTSNNPTERWNYNEIILFIEESLKISNQEDARRREAWKLLKKRIFPFSQPSVAEWNKLDDIVRVYELVVNKRCWNHTFFPDGGGLDLTSVRKSFEEGCIEFDCQGMTNIIKPKKLSFYSPGGDEYGEQDYFILEADNLSFLSSFGDEFCETLTRIDPRQYTDPQCGEWNDFNGQELPEGSCQVQRWRKGKFATFMGWSIYNKKGIYLDGKWIDAYNAPHNNMDQNDFFCFFRNILNREETPQETSVSYIEPMRTRLEATDRLGRDQVQTIKTFISEYSKIDDGYEDDDFSFEKMSEKFFEDLECQRKKLKILSAFSTADIQLITAVMYAGRDNRPPFGATLDTFMRRHTNAEENLDSLSEKSTDCVCRYLTKGLKMYAQNI